MPLECSRQMSGSSPVWLNGPGNPIGIFQYIFSLFIIILFYEELTSPNFPNDFNATNLLCEWVVRPRFGTKVKVTFVQAEMGGDCLSNSLEVFDSGSASGGDALAYPGLKSQCGVSQFPPSYDPVISDGPVTVRFTSRGQDGSAKFKIVVEATPPACDALEDRQTEYSTCPEGPCCQGEGCCVISLGSNETTIVSPNYPGDSGRNLSCSWILKAPNGYNVALNFDDMDMRQDSADSCLNDFVNIADPLNSAHGALNQQGLSFCGELVPNFPSPSLFSSSGNTMVVKYHTDVTNVKRGRGFSAVATAVNPLCTAISYRHKYDDNVCEATCSPHIPPTSPPTPHCYPVDLTTFIVEANTSIPISGASIRIQTLSNGVELAENPYWVAPEQVNVVRLTNLDGSAVQDVTETGTYLIEVTADGFFPHTVEVNITCDDVEYCGDCKPVAIIELEPVPIPPCDDITLEVTVTDSETDEPIVGATISITYENNNETFFTVEDALTNINGEVSIAMTPVTEYTVYVSKEPYFNFNKTVDATCDNQNCSACVDLTLEAPLVKPTCPDVTMSVHVRHNLTDEPVPGATVKVLIVETGEPATNETLVTDATGKVTAPIPMDAEYEVVVIHEDFINQDKVKSVDCDELHCELCAPVVVFELNPNPDPPVCIENGGFIVVTVTDDLTELPIHNARIDYKLLKNNHTRIEDEVIGTNIPTNRNGTTKLRVPTSGRYEVDIYHGDYEETEVQIVDVACADDNSTECSCEWPLPHILTQDFCDDSFLHVVIRDSLTNQAIPGVSVNITLDATNTHLLEDELTDEFGAVKATIEGSAVYLIHVAKEGFKSEDDTTFIYCAPDACDQCTQTLTITMEPEPGCDVDMFAEITVTDSISQSPIENVTVTITLTEFANGPSNENVGGLLLTDEEGKVKPRLFVDGNYTVTLNSPDHLTVESGFELNTYETCENPVLPLQMVPIVPPMCEPIINITVVDNSTLLPIPLASLNLTLQLQEEIAGSAFELVGLNLLTDQNGMVFYESLAYGNLTATVTAEGYHPNTGTLEVICDGFNCADCQLVLDVELEEIHCPVSEVTITVVDELTEEPIPNAVVTYTLTSTPETGGTFITFPSNTTNEDGVVTFPLIHMGNYTITVEKDGYDPVETPTDLECNPEHCEACLPVFKVPIRKEYCDDVTLSLWVANGVTNEPLTNATVDVVVLGFEGLLRPAGRVIVDEEGWAKIPIIGDGTYMYNIEYPGFAPTQDMQVVDLQEMMTGEDPNCDLIGLVEMGARPVFPPKECGDAETEGVRITLAWGENPADLDLYSYKVSRDDPQDTCLAYYCDQKELCGCMEFTNDVTTGGLNGTESISYCCNEPEIYMIYVDEKSTKGLTMKTSEARIYLTESSGTREVIKIDPSNVPSGLDARYWIAGCMVIEETVPQFTKVDQYFSQDPKVSDPLLCYNLIKSISSTPTPMIPAVITVKDQKTNLPIIGAVTKLSLISDTIERVVEEITIDDGTALATLDSPGTYEIIVEADGYITDRDTLTVACRSDELDVCFAEVVVSLMPEIAPGSIELTLDWDGEPGPRNLDLHLYQVSKEDTSRTCNTFFGNSNGCSGVLGSSDSQDGLTGGESVVLTDISANSGFTYMVFVKKSGDKDIFASGARITLTDGQVARTVALNRPLQDTASSSESPNFWIAGCLQIVGQSYNFVPVNNFYQINPIANGNPNRLHCHNLFQIAPPSVDEPRPFCDNADIKVNVRDAVSFSAVTTAKVSISLIEDDIVSVLATEAPADLNGHVGVRIHSNGNYEIKISADGYVTDSDILKVDCNVNDCASCLHNVFVSLSPMVNTGTARIMLGWGEMPNNWDLKTLQVKMTDPSDSCITSSQESCAGTVGPIDQTNSNGAETLDVSNNEYTYLIYVKNACGVPYSTVSASHITITDGFETEKTYLAVENYNRETFWVIGCLRFKREGYMYREINEFTSEDPSAAGNIMRMYCHNTLGANVEIEATTTPSPPVPVNVKVSIRDPSTNQPVDGAEVSVTFSESNSTIDTTADENGIATIPVYNNGFYTVTAHTPSYFITGQSFIVDCYGNPICDPEVTFNLVPTVESPDVRLIAEWLPSIDDIKMDILEVSSAGDSCTLSGPRSCGSIDIESPSNTSGASSLLISGSPDTEGSSYLVYLSNDETSGRDFTYSGASLTIVDSTSGTKVEIPRTRMMFNTVAEALLFGGWRSKEAVDSMSEEARRNTLIVELEKITIYSIEYLQGLPSNGNLKSLVGIAAIGVFLESRSIRSTAELLAMTYEEQRNTLIEDLNVNGGLDVSYLQGLGDFLLAAQGFRVQFYNQRNIRAASFGQSYWIIGCMNIVNGTKRFETVNKFSSLLPENENRLFCHNLLDLPTPATRRPPSFWDGKFLTVNARNAIDNTNTEVCVDAVHSKENAAGVSIATSVLEDVCGSNVQIPLSETGSGRYTIELTATGFVGITESVDLTEASCGNGPNCMLYLTISPIPATGKTRAMLSWDSSVEGLDLSLYQIDAGLPITEPGCLLNSTSAASCGQAVTRNIANVLDGSLGGSAYTAAGSQEYSYMIFTPMPSSANSLPIMAEATIENAILFGSWRTESQLDDMSAGDMRNTLIVEMNRISSLSIPELQALNSNGNLGSLTGFSAISIYLLTRNIRTSADLGTMNYDDQRNTLITFLAANTDISTRDLQAKSDFELVSLGFSIQFDVSLDFDSIKFLALNKETTEVRSLPSVARIPSSSRFWVIGCLKAYADSFTFVSTDLFTAINPVVENGRYCHNLFMDSERLTFPEDVFIEATVRSALNNRPVMGATVQIATTSSTGVNSGITDGNGTARIPVFNNGTMTVYVNGDGYENTMGYLRVGCADSTCSPKIQFSVAPELRTDNAMITLNWGPNVGNMDMQVIKVDASNSDEFCLTTSGQPRGCHTIRYMHDNSDVDIVNGGLGGFAGGDSVRINDLLDSNLVSYMVVVKNTGAQDKLEAIKTSKSLVTFVTHDSSKRIGIDRKFEFEYSLRGVLVFGGWATISEIFSASMEEQRNTLIVNLNSWSSLSIPDLQAMTNEDLIQFGSVTAFLKVFSIYSANTADILRRMNVQDQTNALLHALSTNTQILLTYRYVVSNQYVGQADLRNYLSQLPRFTLVSNFAFQFKLNIDNVDLRWIAGCVEARGGNVNWVPVGQFASVGFDKFFCHKLLYGDLPEPTTTTTQPPYPAGVGIKLIARNSQNNSPLSGAKGSVSLQTADGLVVVADDVPFNSDGTLFVGVSANGRYSIQIKADGFINADFEMEVSCSSTDCPNEKLVTLSPLMPPGQTRIMINWEKAKPADIDVHVVSVKKSDNSHCKTYFNNKNGCNEVSLDLDNRHGGLNGAETVTLTNNQINSQYRYLVAIMDYEFRHGGEEFINSGASVTITNGQSTVGRGMQATSVDRDAR